jgi:hypothetical protein
MGMSKGEKVKRLKGQKAKGNAEAASAASSLPF